MQLIAGVRYMKYGEVARRTITQFVLLSRSLDYAMCTAAQSWAGHRGLEVIWRSSVVEAKGLVRRIGQVLPSYHERDIGVMKARHTTRAKAKTNPKKGPETTAATERLEHGLHLLLPQA